MSMLDRRSRTVPTSAGPDEETIRLDTSDLRKRRRAVRRSGRRRRLRLVLGLLLVVALVAGAVWTVFFSSLVTVTGVQVTGNATVGAARIERVAAVPPGTPLARVDLAAIRARVSAIAAVRSVEVSRSWPHQVHVAVTERVPVAVINRGSGLQGLDDQGVLFGSYATRPQRLPLVRTQPDTPAEALTEGGKVIGSLPPRIAARVDTVEVDSVDQITLDLRGGRKVVWGSSDQSAQKSAVLGVLLRHPGQTIDVSVPASPTTR